MRSFVTISSVADELNTSGSPNSSHVAFKTFCATHEATLLFHFNITFSCILKHEKLRREQDQKDLLNLPSYRVMNCCTVMCSLKFVFANNVIS